MIRVSGCVLSFSRVQLFETPWTVAHQAPLSMIFSRQEYWNGCHFLLHGIFLTQDGTHVSCISCTGRQILYHCACHLGSPRKTQWQIKLFTKELITQPCVYYIQTYERLNLKQTRTAYYIYMVCYHFCKTGVKKYEMVCIHWKKVSGRINKKLLTVADFSGRQNDSG